MLVLIDLVRSETPEYITSVDTVWDYWTRTMTDTKLTSMRSCDMLMNPGPVCHTYYWSKIELRQVE